MELTALEIACIAGGFGILGTLLGSIINHFLGKDIARRAEHNQAVREFINAFQDELSRLKHSKETPFAIIQPAIFKHQTATSIFKPRMPYNKKAAFTLAWKDYLVAAPSQYEREEQKHAKDEYRLLLCEKIEKLFEFVKYK